LANKTSKIDGQGALAYGGAGSWAVRDPAIDKISPILLGFFNALNQSYFMSAFFLLAGYFTPRSLEKKGVKQFLTDRLIRRLGIPPILIYTTLIINLSEYMLGLFTEEFPNKLEKIFTRIFTEGIFKDQKQEVNE
jgi:hypothetical protein